MLTRCTCRTGSVPDFRAKRATLGAHLTAPHARSDRRAAPRRVVGTTLIELIVTLSIAAILLTIGVPSFQNIVATNRIASLTNELSGALQLARSEAVTRGKTVTVCKTDDVSDSAPSCNASADWQDGWVVFVDDNNDGDDTGETPLRVGQPSSGNAVISGDANFVDYVKFHPNGQSQGASSLGTTGTITVCIAPNQRSITLNPIGRLSIATGTCP